MTMLALRLLRVQPCLPVALDLEGSLRGSAVLVQERPAEVLALSLGLLVVLIDD